MNQHGHEEAMKALEHSLVKYTLDKASGNVSEAAKTLKVNRTTLYSMKKRLNIK